MNKPEQLASLQKIYMDKDAFAKEREVIHETWFQETTTDFWRHKRMYETIRPLAEYFRSSEWLTVGDGRYGLDAIRMKKLFQLQSVFPTDIGENMLKISKERGLIETFGVENAEHLSFADSSYDVVFCKEAFHHFPRPYLALYEMLRVSKKAVVMIEPAERLILNGAKSKPYLLSAIQLLFSKLTGRTYRPYLPPVLGLTHAFEEAGNYLYAVSVRELEKLVHGMDLGGFAWKGFNDVYGKGCEFEEAKPGNPLYESIGTAIAALDEQCKNNPQYQQPNMVSVILFKEKPDAALVAQLQQAGFELPVIHKNPYV
ncbi:class I SAM-dependent methyltransferase [Lacibacter sp.]|uniref:class I SAM-dependent methyltransferase n=1 Tax=Lacibacter sp. TaxID=1915409 RepID=UPI002B4B5B09|nr:methyltransferase domain-containing protein [Lacibacter sp.]HLP36094.1 methyltransferase domain-containing protein [Lacibacter sp.]